MKVNFQLVAYTDAAGKYTPGAYLNGNEDNFYIDDDLKDDMPCSVKPGEVINLSDEGMIMAVADGMGGMNAGEVASDIAVKTVKEYFTSTCISAEHSSTYEKRREYLEKVIIECDRRIKTDAKSNPEHNGMGSTIILAWMAHGEITISWLGDSRAYRYNPAYGLQALSKDHSYVQELVDKGVITYEQSFDHPQGNIVVRSLGDISSKPQPESRNYTVAKDDIFMLCSDGLSGVLRDRKAINPTTGMPYQEENIEDVIASNYVDICRCREALFEAAERGDWYDNVTVVLCKILSVGGEAFPTGQQGTTQNQQSVAQQQDTTPAETPNANVTKSIHLRISGKGVLYVVMGILVVIAAIVGAIYFLMNTGKNEPQNTKPDTIIVEKNDSVQEGKAMSDGAQKPAEENFKDKDKANNSSDVKSVSKDADKDKVKKLEKEVSKNTQKNALKKMPSVRTKDTDNRLTSSEDPEEENKNQNNPDKK